MDREKVLQVILGKYKEITEDEFSGSFVEEREIPYEGGKSTTRYLVKVHTPKIVDTMRKIWDVDGGDIVWKGIINDTFYAEEIKANFDWMYANAFKIVKVGHVKNLHWMRKEYYAVINVTLEAIYRP